MSSLARRQRSPGEVVFGLLRILLRGHGLWGAGSHLHIAALADALRARETSLIAALSYLESEGFLRLDAGGNVRLTETGAARLLAATGADWRQALS